MFLCSKCKALGLLASKHDGDFCLLPLKGRVQTAIVKITTFCNLREDLLFGLETSNA